MEILKKLLIVILALAAVYCIKTILFDANTITVQNPKKEISLPDNRPENTEKKEDTVQNETISIYFIGQNTKKEDVYKIVKRNYNEEKDGSKLEYALNELLNGPYAKETAQGIYTEIPKGTKLRSISKLNGKLYIDLSGEFEQGGGTDGLYKRLYQLIKTVNKNTAENVYLKIEGREVDVIGGEGIMINQPLSPNSLDG